jgi:aspartate kinase
MQIITTGKRLSVDIALALSHSMGLKSGRLPVHQQNPDLATCSKALAQKMALLDDDTSVYIMEGFYGRNEAGDIDILGRNTSDLSAVLLGHLSASTRIEIYSDQDGICIADPRLVDNPPVFKSMSYEQARTISQLGASIVHRNSISNNFEMTIPLWVKKSHKPDLPGTQITVDTTRSNPYEDNAIKGMCCIFDVTLAAHDNRYHVSNTDTKKSNNKQVFEVNQPLYHSTEMAAMTNKPLSLLSITGLSTADEDMLCMQLEELALDICLVFKGHVDSACSVVVHRQQPRHIANYLYQ